MWNKNKNKTNKKIICPSCHEKHNIDYKYCPFCGTEIIEAKDFVPKKFEELTEKEIHERFEMVYNAAMMEYKAMKDISKNTGSYTANYSYIYNATMNVLTDVHSWKETEALWNTIWKYCDR